jgi:hypothetical protein
MLPLEIKCKILSLTYKDNSELLKNAVINNDTWVFEELEIYPSKINLWELAATCGNLEIIKILDKKKVEGCTTAAMNWAALYGHLEVVKFLHENRGEGCTTAAMNWAALYGHLEIVKFLHENRDEGCTTAAMNWAACNGHLEIVKFLRENRTEGYSFYAIASAQLNGYTEVVKYLTGKTNVFDNNSHIGLMMWIRMQQRAAQN